MNLCKTCGTICPFDDERTECDAYAPMKKENWFISLPTEEKAEVIAQLSSYGGNVEAILEWLKQPHHSVTNCNE